jgi:hypothetical protein
MPRRRKVYDDCAYCGVYDKLSRDHVIPQCLFINGLPGDLPIVYACKTCNNEEKSVNDTYLRDLLILDMDSAEHPITKQHWNSFARAVRRNQSLAANDVLETSRLVKMFTSAGVYAGTAYGFEAQHGRTTQIMKTMVRGLYHKYIGGILPEDASYEVYRMRDMSKVAPDIQMLLQKGARHVRVGDGQVFECIFAYIPEYPGMSLWFLCFYGSVYFSVTTNMTPLQITA